MASCRGGRVRRTVVDASVHLAASPSLDRPAEELEHLGERGYRLDEARQRDATGQGIGLDIPSRVAEMHGLSLTFANAVEGGLQVDLRSSP